MKTEPLIMICCCDFSGQVKGKAFPATDLAEHMQRGIGWVPTNAQITTFNAIAETPFGALGDLMLVPDTGAEMRLDFGGDGPVEHWFLGDILQMDATPWACCPRSILRAALDDLRAETGLEVRAAFEMEMQFVDDAETRFGSGYSLTGFRAKQAYGEALMAALRTAGLEPESFLREWGPGQYEFTIRPQLGLRAADHAVMMRETARATATHRGERVTFTPVLEAGGVGNGMHLHMSLADAEGRNVSYDPAGPGGLSDRAGAFVAGILHHLPSITAFTAPSVISYARLIPHRWSAFYNNLGYRDREASVRICPIADDDDLVAKTNFEVRACDNAASPYLQMAVLVRAGLDGLRKGMSGPDPTHEDLSRLDTAAAEARGLRRLPSSLDEALANLDADAEVRSWFDAPFVDLYLLHKRGEIAHVSGMDEAALHAAYAEVY